MVDQELKFRWLVESASPIREGAGPDTISVDSDPELFSSTINGTTANDGEIPVEPEASSASGSNPDNPPIRTFNFIVSTQVLTRDNYAIEGERVTFSWDDPRDISGDDSAIIEVSNDINALKQKLVNNEAGNGNDFAYSNAEGKAYCWVRLKLWDDMFIPDMDKRLKGIKAIVGEAVRATPPSTSTSMHSMVRPPRPTVSSTAAAAVPQPSVSGYINILVDELESAAESFGVWVNGQLETVAGLPRTPQEVLGWALKRIADGVLVMFALPGYAAAMATGFTEELRATVVGLLMGLPRGIYVMARDSISDIKTLLFDLPRALINLISKDPKFALQVLGAVVNPATGVVMYQLDAEFKKKINNAFSKFSNFIEQASNILGTLWTMLRDNATFSGITNFLGDKIYDSFKKFVGDVGTDYLKYPKDSDPYRYFIGGFIAGDILGYIVMTVGVQFLLAWFTAGVGNMISVVSKLGRLGQVGAVALRLVQKILLFLKQVEDFVAGVVLRVGRSVKNGIGRVLFVLFRLIQTLMNPISEHLIEPLLRAIFNLTDEVKRLVVEMFYKWSYFDAEPGFRIETLARGLVNGVDNANPQHFERIFKETLDVLAYSASDHPGTNVSTNLLRCS